MRLAWIVARRSTATLTAPVIVVFSWYVAKQMEATWSVDWSAASGQIQRSLLWSIALIATVAAWDTSRMRRLGAESLERTYPRSGTAHLLLNGVPALVVGFLSYVAVFLAVATSMRGGGNPYWYYLGVGAMMLVAAVAIGVAGGYFLPRYLAAPVVGITLWLCAAYGSISDSVYIQSLIVLDIKCCGVAQKPMTATLVGQWFWLLGIVLICAALLCWRRAREVRTLGVLAIVAVVAGVSFMSSNDFRLLTKRKPQPVCREESGVTVCMWSAHSQDIDRWLSVAQKYRATFVELGPQPRRYIEHGLNRSGPAGKTIGVIRPGKTDQELMMRALVQPRIYEPPECAQTESVTPGTISYGYYPGVKAREVLAGWFKHEIRPELPPEALVNPTRVGDMRRLLAAPESEQVAWVHEAMAAQDDCVTPMPELP